MSHEAPVQEASPPGDDTEDSNVSKVQSEESPQKMEQLVDGYGPGLTQEEMWKKDQVYRDPPLVRHLSNLSQDKLDALRCMVCRKKGGMKPVDKSHMGIYGG